MKKILKLEKELLFKNNIKEITSISLDSDYKIEDNFVFGNFIIEGEYKIHEVSINKEKFDFKIPFKVELESDIDKETLKLEIVNFVYDYKKDELLVNIEYEIVGEKKDIIVFEDKESLDEFLLNREVEIISNNEKEEELLNNKVEEVEKDVLLKTEIIVDDEERNNESEEVIKPEEVIKTIDKQSDNFITYQIYKIKENDTLESIVLKYKTTVDELKEYNDLSNLNINDKIIIPYYE